MNLRETGLRRYVLLPVQGRPYQWREINQKLEELVTSQKDWSLARDVVTFFFPHTPEYMRANLEGCLIGRELIGPPKDVVEPYVALDWDNKELEYFDIKLKSWDDLFDQVQELWQKRASETKTESRWIFEWQRELNANESKLIGQVAFYS